MITALCLSLGLALTVAALVMVKAKTQHKPPTVPEPAEVAARHRAEDAAEGRPGSDEQWTDLTATVPGMSQRALAEAWQAAQRANERLGDDDA